MPKAFGWNEQKMIIEVASKEDCEQNSDNLSNKIDTTVNAVSLTSLASKAAMESASATEENYILSSSNTNSDIIVKKPISSLYDIFKKYFSTWKNVPAAEFFQTDVKVNVENFACQYNDKTKMCMIRFMINDIDVPSKVFDQVSLGWINGKYRPVNSIFNTVTSLSGSTPIHSNIRLLNSGDFNIQLINRGGSGSLKYAFVYVTLTYLCV